MMIAHILIPVIVLALFLTHASGAIALGLGITCGVLFTNPYQKHSKKYVSHLLGICIVALGAGMNLSEILKVGASGVVVTIASITLVMIVGLVLGRILGVSRELSLLISAGTAICGGSAIAAVSTAIRAKSENTTVSFAVVFVLNATALLIFPKIGNLFQLSQEQFGFWSGIAIHDTSSVIGAAMQFGERALEVASTIKLTRAIWIAPLVVLVQFFFAKSKREMGKFYLPWFIGGFLVAAFLVTFVPELQLAGKFLSGVAKRLFVVTLFLIGSHISRSSFKEMGWRPLLHGILLWFVTALSTLAYVICLEAA